LLQNAVKCRVQQTALLDAPLSTLGYAGGRRGVGLKRLGATDLRSLLELYPSRYHDFSQLVPIAQASLHQPCSIAGEVHEVKSRRPRPRLTLTEVTLTDASGSCIVSFFNQPWLSEALPKGTRMLCLGQMEVFSGYRRLASPQFLILEAGKEQGIQPVYRVNSDISQGWLRRFITDALQRCSGMLDPLPVGLRSRLGLMSKRQALAAIHFPASNSELCQARQRLAFEEAFLLQLYLAQQRMQEGRLAVGRAIAVDQSLLERLEALLPFTLTADQRQAVSEVLSDLGRPQPMRRLLMGEVGSGKTMVALQALVAVAGSTRQAAMMAPTEVLAEQYALQLGPTLDQLGVSWARLSSSTAEKDRQQIKRHLADGLLKVMFGTHALIDPDVRFTDLGLVVIDEQHRFGVNQRQALYDKGVAVHRLSMTATPIPRSLALTLYGDQDISVIRSRPRPRVSIRTKVLQNTSIDRAYQSLRQAIDRREQAYIVCPLIGLPRAAARPAGGDGAADGLAGSGGAADESCDLQLLTEFSPPADSANLRAATDELDFLAKKVFVGRRLALMTSLLPAKEKQQVMAEFRAGRIDILVSTTVIEVGVDVPNATVMIIRDAERFGLSQLHQLRGRVGRGHKDGQVFLVSGTKQKEALQRLRLMESCNDGFELSRADLCLRQEGDVLGLRQHGQAGLKLIQVIRDAELIQSAHTEARNLLAEDPQLKRDEHALLRQQLQRLSAQHKAADHREVPN